MTQPTRIRLSRAKGWRMPPNTVKVDRTTIFGNPFPLTETRSAAEIVGVFETWLTVDGCTARIPERKAALLTALPRLRGKNLACWCRLDAPCHADVLLGLANAKPLPFSPLRGALGFFDVPS